jgi:hypothetical protein
MKSWELRDEIKRVCFIHIPGEGHDYTFERMLENTYIENNRYMESALRAISLGFEMTKAIKQGNNRRAMTKMLEFEAEAESLLGRIENSDTPQI